MPIALPFSFFPCVRNTLTSDRIAPFTVLTAKAFTTSLKRNQEIYSPLHYLTTNATQTILTANHFFSR